MGLPPGRPISYARLPTLKVALATARPSCSAHPTGLSETILDDGIMAQEPWTAERVRGMMTNPTYCLSEPTIVAEDVWGAAGVKLIREMRGRGSTCTWCSPISARHLRSRSVPEAG